MSLALSARPAALHKGRAARAGRRRALRVAATSWVSREACAPPCVLLESAACNARRPLPPRRLPYLPPPVRRRRCLLAPCAAARSRVLVLKTALRSRTSPCRRTRRACSRARPWRASSSASCLPSRHGCGGAGLRAHACVASPGSLAGMLDAGSSACARACLPTCGLAEHAAGAHAMRTRRWRATRISGARCRSLRCSRRRSCARSARRVGGEA